jgi:hypothetical protein
VLFGEARAGSAHAQYALATELLSEGFREHWLRVLELREKSPAQAHVLSDRLLEKNQAAIHAIQDGAHRRDGKFRVVWLT